MPRPATHTKNMQYSSVGADARVPFQQVSFKIKAPSALVRGRIVRLQIGTNGEVSLVAGSVDSDTAFTNNPAAIFGVVGNDAATAESVAIIVCGIVEVQFLGRGSDNNTEGVAIESGMAICRNELLSAAAVSSYGAACLTADVVLGVVIGTIGVELVSVNTFGYAKVLFDGVTKFGQK